MNLEQNIIELLDAKFAPVYLEVVNESHGHNVPPNSQTHFKVVLATDAFAGKPLVQRHRAVYETLQGPLEAGVHALALHTFTPQEWKDKAQAPASPECMGGGKK